MSSDLLLKLRNSLLIAERILRLSLEGPVKEGVGVVGLKVGLQNTEPLTIFGDLVPVTPDVLEILGKVGVASLKDLAVEVCAHGRLEVDVLSPRLVRLLEDKVGRLLHGAEERAHLFRVLTNEAFVTNV